MRSGENTAVQDAAQIQGRLAIHGGTPIRTEPLPLEFPGVHHIDEQESEAAARVIASRSLFRYYGLNPQKEVEAFEREFAGFLGVSHALAVTSGTGALNVALSALGIGPGQEVIVPAYMWVAVAGAVVSHGAIPVLADIDDTFCLDPKSLEERISPKTSGIIVVHMSGAPADIKAIREVARRRNLFLVEDCAQCIGGSVDGQKVGSFGDIATFSFQMNKNITSGEGGCVVTNDRRLYERAFACHDLGYARDEKGRLKLDNPDLLLWGLGYRMDELRGALLRIQLAKLPQITANMHRSKYRIRKALERLPGIGLRRIVDPEGDTGPFLITTYRDALTAKLVNQALRAEGIVTFPQGISNIMMSDWGMHLYYNIASLVQRTSVDGKGFPWKLSENSGSTARYEKGTCPVADSLFERSTLLAIPSSLSERDEEDIIQAFEKVHGALLA
ncbi:MAG TPA: DegT/DnrJ/EryC1/StrS family aminotransferase [Alloacidobacterium sp.]|jgi:8-amino-3,8-dideoxy-alpha-D-manno-octulosonate transaminase|nr:DegT/DnrJ/EryC1/StrS family aminotransferase [Alloacidobacterium sp.]